MCHVVDAVDGGSVSRSSSRVLTTMFAISASALISVRHGIPLMAMRRDRLVVALNTQVTGWVLQVDPWLVGTALRTGKRRVAVAVLGRS
jgi:hypothetical protein